MHGRPKKLSQRPAPLAVADAHADALADVLRSSRLHNVLYRRLECRAPWGLRLTESPFARFYLVARGTLWLEVQGEEPCELSAGDVAFLPYGGDHTLRDSLHTRPTHIRDGGACRTAAPRTWGGDGAPCSLLAGYFDLGEGRESTMLGTLPRLLRLSAAEGASGPWVAATVQLMVAESAAPGPAGSLVLSRLADVLFIQALRALSSRGDCASHGVRALADPALSRALALLHSRVAEPWTVASLAARVGLSRSAFAARFHALVGEPPLQYLARWRMARAAELLRDTEEPLAVVASRVGYESAPSFHKAFKRWRGQSPGAFRRQRAGEGAGRSQ